MGSVKEDSEGRPDQGESRGDLPAVTALACGLSSLLEGKTMWLEALSSRE